MFEDLSKKVNKNGFSSCLFSKESLRYLGVDAAAVGGLSALAGSVKLYDCKVKHMTVVKWLSYYLIL